MVFLDINDCSPNPCQNGGTCTDQVNNYTCSCAAGYTGKICQTGKCNVQNPGAPLTYFNEGGGVVRVIFLGLKFWQKVIFSVYGRRWDSFWVTKKKREIFLGCEKKGLRDFFGYVKKNGDFLGIKYEPLSDLPVIKILSGAPGV